MNPTFPHNPRPQAPHPRCSSIHTITTAIIPFSFPSLGNSGAFLPSLSPSGSRARLVWKRRRDFWIPPCPWKPPLARAKANGTEECYTRRGLWNGQVPAFSSQKTKNKGITALVQGDGAIPGGAQAGSRHWEAWTSRFPLPRKMPRAEDRKSVV